MFPNLGRPSSCRRAEVAHLPALPRGLAPDFRPARCLTRRHQSASARRRFRATTAHSPGRLPSMRSSTLHRGSTRAFAFNRSRALAKHPCREEEPAPARHEQTRWRRTNAIPRVGPVDPLALDPPEPETCPSSLSCVRYSRKRGHPIDTKDASHQLLQTDHLERAPNRIGDLPVRIRRRSPRERFAPSRACLSAPLVPAVREDPGGPKPVECPSCQSAFDDAPRASVTALAIPLHEAERGSSGSVTTIACRRSCPVVGRLASSRSSVLICRPSPARTRLGASSALPRAIADNLL